MLALTHEINHDGLRFSLTPLQGAKHDIDPIGTAPATRLCRIIAPREVNPKALRMISLLRNLLDRVLLICAVVAGGLVPGFIAQYRQRLGGRLHQARIDLEPWQKIADQLYHGDLNKLIDYHLSSHDPTFHADGSAIRALVTSVQHLQADVDALHTSLFHQVGYLMLHLDTTIARATWGDWVPTFTLSTEGIAFALLFALALWLLFQGLWSILAKIGSPLRQHAPPSLSRRERD